MVGYPTAYRPGAKAFQGPQAFNSGPGWSGAGSANPNPYNKSYGMYGGGEVLAPLKEKTSNPLYPPLTGAPPSQLPANPYNKSTGFGYGQSKGARSAALRRAANMSRGYNMVNLAYKLYQLSQLAGDPQQPVNQWVVPGGTECFPQCGPIDKLVGAVSSTCPTLTCGSLAAGPLGSEPVTVLHRRILGVQEVAPGGVVRWAHNAVWIRPANSADPYLQTRVGVRTLPLNWPFPEVMPIQKPLGRPLEFPYKERSHLPVTDYREAGNTLPVTPRYKPPYVPLAVHHMQPTLPRGGREKKPRMSGIWAAIGVVTELDDALECAHKALPKKEKKKIEGRSVHGQTMYYWHANWAKQHGKSAQQIADHNKRYKMGKPVHQTPQKMVEELMKHGEFTPAEMQKFHECQSGNAAIDTLIGKTAQDTVGAANRARSRQGLAPAWLHIGSGPAL